MRRYFNTEGLCRPDEHYMVHLDDRLNKIKRLFVDRKKYFAINRGRQYGKTTTLRALAEYIKEDYLVISIDFQMLSTASFENENIFSRAFTQLLTEKLERMQAENKKELIDLLCFDKGERETLRNLFARLSKLCEKSVKPVVLMIDEADSASNHQVFLDLKPIINGTGNYYIEAQTRDARRTDVVVDYQGEQFVVELKIWRGNEYNERGEEQLAGYLDYFHQEKGYMLSFNFNKKKEIGVKEIEVRGKTVVEAVA